MNLDSPSQLRASGRFAQIWEERLIGSCRGTDHSVANLQQHHGVDASTIF
jgi:hypothetical protein